MNLVKLALPAAMIFFSGCRTFSVDLRKPIPAQNPTLVKKIYEEAVKLVNKTIPQRQLDPKMPPPEIRFLEACPDLERSECRNMRGEDRERCPYKSKGLGYRDYRDPRDKKIRICLQRFTDTLDKQKLKGLSHYIIGHEILHDLLERKELLGNEAAVCDHQIIYSHRYLHHLIEFINKKLSLPANNEAEKIALGSLENSVKQDEPKCRGKSSCIIRGGQQLEWDPVTGQLKCPNQP